MSEAAGGKVRIIGGGLSGLFAAYAFVKNGRAVELFEKSSRLGGMVQTLRLPWGVAETAANAMLNTKRVEEMVNDIGVEITGMRKAFRRRYIFRHKPRQMPLSHLETLRFTVGMLRRSPPQVGESLWDYGQRSFGFGATKYLIEPAAMGIFGVEASRLSANLVYDYFFKYRSAKPSGARGSVAPLKGMGALVEGLAHWLRQKGVEIHMGTPGEVKEGRLNVIATDATTAADLLGAHAPTFAAQLRHIQYESLYSVTLGFDEPGNLKGFGCLFPRETGFKSLGVLFNNYIFPERGPLYTETWILPAQGLNEDDAFVAILADREKVPQITGRPTSPQHRVVTHWAKALPVYDSTLERALRSMTLPPNIKLLGNYTGRLGLSKILDQAFEMASS